ncbi:hypothetical protein [Rhodanobacter sp. Root480]|uniref:hypothetical protein n=1 Tax=Rhodanobacter sp. Root480 TaxID=1736542 RepID=UPI000B1796EB|nr:hypothetical protein [Rhodanobacter sp. Root480]
MRRTLDALTKLETQWSALKSQRSGDFATGIAGFEGLSYQSFEEVFNDWRARLEKLDKSKWMETVQAELADAVLSKQVIEAHGFAAQAPSNGVNWLLNSTEFVRRVVDVGQMMAVISDRRAGAARTLGKELELRGVEELAAVLKAGDRAKEIERQSEVAANTSEKLAQSTKQANDTLTEISAASEKLNTLRTEINESHKAISERRAEVETLHTDVVGFRSRAETKAGEFDQRIDELTEEVAAAKLETTEAMQSLRKTLVDVRRQGLAKAFSERATGIFRERIIWLIVFAAAVSGLALTAIWFALTLEALTYEALLVALLRRVALAAPMIWLGWYAAKQLGRLSRIQEDYEYKAATALAFESYRNEVKDSNDDALMSDLLKTTITNFGDNPVRLYEHAAKDSASPTDDLLSQLESNGIIKTWVKLQSIFGLGKA